MSTILMSDFGGSVVSNEVEFNLALITLKHVEGFFAKTPKNTSC